MVQIMKPWPKYKNITRGQGHRAAWATESLTGVLPLTLGHSFPGLTSSQLRNDVGTWPLPHSSALRPVGWAGGFQESSRGLGQPVYATENTDEVFGKSNPWK